jgi:glutamine amidotransferase
MVRVAILDYGAGNIFSLKSALERCGAEVDVVTDMAGAEPCSGILLPGVGNFDPAVRSIRKGLQGGRVGLAEGSVPVLGICLGMEAFFERSEEGTEAGLGAIGGEVVMLPDAMKVPHMGWNDLRIRKPIRLLEGVDDGSWVYFVHSYMARPASEDVVAADSDYGVRIPAVVQKGNLTGTQFHPEKSGAVGRVMIRNFLEECKK